MQNLSSPRLRKTFYAAARMTVICEACEEHYEHIAKFRHEVRGEKIRRGGFREFERIVKNAIRDKKLGCAACPKCMYVQSWMKRHFRRRWTLTGLISGVVLAILWAAYVGQTKPVAPEMIVIIGTLAAFVGAGSLVGAVCSALFVKQQEKAAGSPKGIAPQNVTFIPSQQA